MQLQDPTEKHFCDVGILGKYEVNNKLCFTTNVSWFAQTEKHDKKLMGTMFLQQCF